MAKLGGTLLPKRLGYRHSERSEESVSSLDRLFTTLCFVLSDRIMKRLRLIPNKMESTRNDTHVISADHRTRSIVAINLSVLGKVNCIRNVYLP